MKKLVCNVRLESWVEPILKDMATLHRLGFIREETLHAIARLLLRDGVQVGPAYVSEE